MEKTKIRLMLDYPFFGALALSMPLIENPNIRTVDTNGERIQYNPEFIKDKTPNEKLFLYLHEIGHVILGHPFRRGNRNQDKWNIACDHATNLLLRSSGGVPIPENTHCDEQYTDWSAERIYDTISDFPEGEEELQGGSDLNQSQPDRSETQYQNMVDTTWECGRVEDSPPDSERDEASVQATMAIINRISTASNHSVPAAIRDLVNTLTTPKIAWPSLLSRFIYESCQIDYDWMRPDMRYSGAGGIMLPSLHSDNGITLVVILDTSGSVDQHLLSLFFTEFKSIISSINYISVTVICCSDSVDQMKTFYKGEVIEYELLGGGQTNFVPAFEAINTLGVQPACVIYFTDLFSDSFGSPPAYPVLWIGNYEHGWEEKHRARVPFGEVINMEI